MSELLPNEHTDAEIAAGIRDATVDRSDMAGFWGWRAANAILRLTRERDAIDARAMDLQALCDKQALRIAAVEKERDEARAAALEEAARECEKMRCVFHPNEVITARCAAAIRALAPREGGGDE